MKALATLAALLVSMTTLVTVSWAELFPPMSTNLSDPDAIVASMRHRGARDLPLEALTFYEAGLAAARSGDRELAADRFTHAVEFDPAFPEAYMALARVQLFSDPVAAARSLVGAGRAFLGSFGAQHLFLVNSLFAGLVGCGLAALLVVLYAALRLLHRVHHSVSEIGRRWFPAPVAAVIAALLFVTPFMWRVGLVPVSLLFGGIMWNWMQRGERRAVATLALLAVVSPLLLWVLSPAIYSPLDPTERPILISRAMAAPHSPELVRTLREAIDRHPDDPALWFALGAMESRGGALHTADQAFRKAMELGAPEAEAQNNLGAVAFRRGQYDQAIDHLQRSVEKDSRLAAPHFNLSQAYAKKLYFERADSEMLEANRLSFNRIRAALRLQSEAATSLLITEPLPASSLWKSTWNGPRRTPELPSWMRFAYPGALMSLPVMGLLLFGAGLYVGRRIHHILPSHACTNCGKAVCRRCLRRIRKQAYCTACGDALLRIHSAAYSRLVLDSRLKRGRSIPALILRVGTWILPGFEALRKGHTAIGAALGAATLFTLLGLLRGVVPVSRLAWLEQGPGLWWPEIPLLSLVAIMALSLIAGIKLNPVVPEREADASDEGALDPYGEDTRHTRAAA